MAEGENSLQLLAERIAERLDRCEQRLDRIADLLERFAEPNKSRRDADRDRLPAFLKIDRYADGEHPPAFMEADPPSGGFLLEFVRREP